jgi:outer membrane receptor for ferric coprogen and ferric-rhodotorulic acid
MFFDIDEYLSIDNTYNIKDWLNNYLDVGAIAVNWRLFGDSGLKCVSDGNYSLVTRFTRCEKKLNPHVKQILNFNNVFNRYEFANPHFLTPLYYELQHKISVNTAKDRFVVGALNEDQEYLGV